MRHVGKGAFLGRAGGLCLASMLSVFQGAAMPRLRLAPAGLGIWIWISGDLKGVISGFIGTLSVCSNCGWVCFCQSQLLRFKRDFIFTLLFCQNDTTLWESIPLERDKAQAVFWPKTILWFHFQTLQESTVNIKGVNTVRMNMTQPQAGVRGTPSLNAFVKVSSL